jgi:hydroxymethylpyrimidine pyrophosphatase-like HAD family hydrolase
MKLKKQEAIICDIHGTLINHDGTINEDIVIMLCALRDTYSILLVTAHYYENAEQIVSEIKRTNLAWSSHFYYNTNKSDNDDAFIKEFIYHDEIKDVFDVKMVIDNNKDCIKMFRKLGLSTMRFKKGDE